MRDDMRSARENGRARSLLPRGLCANLRCEYNFSRNMSKTSASVSSGVPETEKQMKAAECFYFFEVSEAPDETRSTSF